MHLMCSNCSCDPFERSGVTTCPSHKHIAIYLLQETKRPAASEWGCYARLASWSTLSASRHGRRQWTLLDFEDWQRIPSMSLRSLHRWSWSPTLFFRILHRQKLLRRHECCCCYRSLRLCASFQVLCVPPGSCRGLQSMR